MTLNGVMAVILRCFTEFGSFTGPIAYQWLYLNAYCLRVVQRICFGIRLRTPHSSAKIRIVQQLNSCFRKLPGCFPDMIQRERSVKVTFEVILSVVWRHVVC